MLHFANPFGNSHQVVGKVVTQHGRKVQPFALFRRRFEQHIGKTTAQFRNELTGFGGRRFVYTGYIPVPRQVAFNNGIYRPQNAIVCCCTLQNSSAYCACRMYEHRIFKRQLCGYALDSMIGYGNDATIGFAASQGNFELNVFKPVIIYNFIQSVRLLADAIRSFNQNCAVGIEANEEVIKQFVQRSLMLATALNSHIGYEKAAEIAKLAYKDNSTLKEAAVKTGYVTEEQFDEWIKLEKMI